MTAGTFVGASVMLKSFYGLSFTQLGKKFYFYTESFVNEHVLVPVSETKELLLRERKHSVGNPEQLELSRTELRNMLVDFVQQTVGSRNDMSAEKKAELLALAQKGDVNAVENSLSEATAHSVRNMIFGNLLQLLLINAEAVKVHVALCLHVCPALLY